MTSMAGTPLVVKPRAAGSSGSRVRAMRCNASVATDAEARMKASAFPFVKIVGQDELKLALILNVIVRRQAAVRSRGNWGGRGWVPTVLVLRARVVPSHETNETWDAWGIMSEKNHD